MKQPIYMDYADQFAFAAKIIYIFCYPAFNLDFFIAIYFQLLRIVVGSVGYLFKPCFANLKKLTKIEINPWNNGWILWNPQYPSFLKFNGHLPDI